MITIGCCVVILLSIAVTARRLGGQTPSEEDVSFQRLGYQIALGGFVLLYVSQLGQELHGNVAWYIPTYRFQVVLAAMTIASVGFAIHTSAHGPLMKSMADWWRNDAGAPRVDLFCAIALLATGATILLLAPAYLVNGRLPVLHPWRVQVAASAAVAPVFLWLGRLSIAVGKQLALGHDGRTRVRFVTYCVLIWLTSRMLFDVVLGSTWHGWVEVGLVIDTMLFGGVTFLVVASSRRRMVEAIDRFVTEYVMASMEEAMIAVDAEGIIRAVNHSAERMTDQPPADLLGRRAPEVLDARQWILGGETPTRALRQHEEVRSFPTAAGETRYVASRVVALADGLGNAAGCVEILHDITEYKEAQERLAEYSQMLEDRIADRSRALAESEERHRGLVDNLADCLLILKDGAVRFANPAAKTLWQQTLPGLHGANVADLWDVGVAAPWSELRTRLAEEPGTAWRGEMVWRVGPGEEREFLVTASTARWEGEPAILVVGNDNTERAKLQASLDRVHRLQALGTLTGGIAHDFNNYLTSILGRLSMLEQQEEPGSASHRNAQRALEAAEKARQLIARLMRFSRPEETGREPTDLCDLLRDTEPLLKSLVREEIRLEWHLPDGGLWADVDASAIQEILLNLAKNADEAMRNAPGVLLVTARVHEDAEQPSVQILVADTGPGLSPEARDHLFEPFFTTKPVGQGHGLGLALAHQIMQEHGGDIDATSEPGRGTTFVLTMPACEAPAPAASGVADIALVEGQGEVVLVVDDDPDVLQTACDMLVRLGYRVLTAENGQRALDVIEHEPNVTAIVMDVVMPKMNGVDCAKELAARGCTAPVIFMTGYDPDPERMRALGIESVMISKPFRLRELADVLSQQIAARRAVA